MLLDAERKRALVAEIQWTRAKVDVSLFDSLRRRVREDPAFAGIECKYAFAREGHRGSRKHQRAPSTISSPIANRKERSA